MKRLRITVIDLVAKGPGVRLFSRIMNANYAGIMPQVIAVWCEKLGHRVRYVCYTGTETITASLVDETDVLIVGAFTRSAFAAYALSNIYRGKGAITVLGGPHARCYPQDAAKYFDYVLGFTDRELIEDIISDRAPQRPIGIRLGAKRQPTRLPGVKERWKFIEPTVARAPAIKLVPMIGSMGCPYSCSFCIDSTVDYKPLGSDEIGEDLRFLAAKMKRPRVAWHDPNFGIRFNDCMAAIEDAIEPGRIEFVAESSLSLLSEANLKRLRRNGFVGMLTGVESWYGYGNKSKTGRSRGMAKVRGVSDHLNMVLSYIPYVQANFVLGLDCDKGKESFEITKEFLDRTPGVYPTFSLFTCYGQAAPMNLELQRDGRVVPFPFHFLDSIRAMNVRPLHYGWKEFHDLTTDLTRYALSAPRMYRRFRANRDWTTKWLHLIRAGSSSRVKYQSRISHMLATDDAVRRYFDGESTVLPEPFRIQIECSLDRLWDALPEGALEHDQNAYLHDHSATLGRRPKAGNGRAIAAPGPSSVDISGIPLGTGM